MRCNLISSLDLIASNNSTSSSSTRIKSMQVPSNFKLSRELTLSFPNLRYLKLSTPSRKIPKNSSQRNNNPQNNNRKSNSQQHSQSNHEIDRFTLFINISYKLKNYIAKYYIILYNIIYSYGLLEDLRYIAARQNNSSNSSRIEFFSICT